MKMSLAVAAAASLTCAVTLAGCGGSDGTESQEAGKTEGGKGVVTAQQANAVLDNYVKTNNQANNDRDPRALQSVEGGVLYELSKGTMRQDSLLSAKERADVRKPFYYVERRFHIPADTDWFAADVRIKNSDGSLADDRRFMIFDRAGGTGQWKLVATADTDAPLPKVTVDAAGNAATVPATRKTGALAPAQIADAFNDILVTGGKGSGRQISGRVVKQAHDVYKNRHKNMKSAMVGFAADKPAGNTSSYSLKTENGALTVFAGAYNRAIAIANGTLTPSPAVATYIGKQARTSIIMRFQYLGIAIQPTTGKATLDSYDEELVGAGTATPPGG